MSILVKILCLLGLFATLAVSLPASKSNGKRVVCYFGSWAVYRWGKAKITANDIDCSLCSHFIYTFVGLDESSGKIIYLDAYNDIGDEWKVGLLPTLQKKCRASGTKFMVAVGGWNEGSPKYSNVVSDPAKRETFKNSIISFVEKHNLDGFDLDWEYPGQRGGAPDDKNNLKLFLDDLYPEFEKKNWELTAAVTANAETIDQSYDVRHFSTHLSFINIMAYDLHGSWDEAVGHHAALYRGPADGPNAKHLNIDAAVRRWIELGAAPDKLVLGLATYGRSASLVNPNQYKIGSSIRGAGPHGWVNEAGFYGFNDVCFNNKTEWTTEWDDVQKVPYAHSGTKWVGYDDVTSITIKTCYAREKALGGIMFWTVETDDFAGICNMGKYPLIQAGLKALVGDCGSYGLKPEAPAGTESPIADEEIAEPEQTEAPAVEPEQTEAPAVEPEQTEAPAVEPEQTEAPAVEPEQTVAPAVEPEETEAPATEPAVETEQTTTAPATEPPAGNFVCLSEGQMLKDPANCSQYLVCVRNAIGKFSMVAMKCSHGLVYDQVVKGCNYRSLSNC